MAEPAQSGYSASGSGQTGPSGEFTRVFGTLNADALPTEAPLKDEPALFAPGAFTQLFGPKDQPVERPANSSQPDTFARMFNPEASEVQAGPANAPRFGDGYGTGLPAPPLPAPNVSHAEEPFAASPQRVEPEYPNQRPFNELPPDFAPSNPPANDLQKATRLFRSDRPTLDGQSAFSGPSAYTRVINSSAQRSAQENAEPNPAVANKPAPAIVQAPAPVVPSWPMGSIQAPSVQPAAYLPPQPVQMQMQMPPMTPPAWPQGSSLPAVSQSLAPQPHLPPSEQTIEQKWIAYMPLIIALNVLFFIAALFILIVAVSR